jgi:hypothetical protein
MYCTVLYIDGTELLCVKKISDIGVLITKILATPLAPTSKPFCIVFGTALPNSFTARHVLSLSALVPPNLLFSLSSLICDFLSSEQSDAVSLSLLQIDYQQQVAAH